MNTHLLPSLKKYQLTYEVKAVEDLGSWQKNTAYKSEFVLDMLLKHKKSVIFIDADATIQRFPALFEQISSEFDIAVHYQDWWKQWRNNDCGKRFDLLSGTIMFRYNERVLALVRNWTEKMKSSGEWEQKILQKLTEENQEIKIYKLPVEYCTVIMHNKSIPKYIKSEEVVILHHQKSRQYKNRRSWNPKKGK